MVVFASGEMVSIRGSLLKLYQEDGRKCIETADYGDNEVERYARY